MPYSMTDRIVTVNVTPLALKRAVQEQTSAHSYQELTEMIQGGYTPTFSRRSADHLIIAACLMQDIPNIRIFWRD